MSKNDKAWERIFNDYHIVNSVKENGSFVINANQIRDYGREPRLMTKFDHKVNLPRVFQDNGLSILPTTRGEYIISSFEAYQKLEEPFGKIEYFSVPDYIQTLSQEFVVSEAIALNCANACGIMEDFLEDNVLKSTISGRMGTDSFSFDIKSNSGIKTVNVSNSQIEIDASYEGVRYFSIFEAKQDLSDDFLVRQLYYPYRVWKERISKQIKTIFFVYSNGVFNLYQYEFDDPNVYNSAKLVKFKRYSISNKITINEIVNILNRTLIENEPEIPFPQANSMPRIINLLELLAVRELSKEEITSEYDFDSRQTNYYTDALRYLGLVEKYRIDNYIKFKLSKLGKDVMSLNLKDRQLEIVYRILSHKPFNYSLKLWLNSGSLPDIITIENIMKESELFNIGTDATYHRRASTVIGWLKWIIELCEE